LWCIGDENVQDAGILFYSLAVQSELKLCL